MKKQKIKITILESHELNATRKEEMWEVYHPYYHYTKLSFMERISRNTHYAIYSLEGKIVGFTGLRIDRTKVNGRRKLFIYFGQTVIDAQYRGSSLIPRTGAQLTLRYWQDIMLSDIYFWADTLTYKAYLVFAKTLDEFYPNYLAATPQPIRQMVNFLGEKHYGHTFCSQTGTIRKETVLVNDPCIVIPHKYKRDPDIRFFTQVNPGFSQGNGLLTLAPLNKRNFWLLMKRLLSIPGGKGVPKK